MSHDNTAAKTSFFRLELTSEQQAQVRNTTGIESKALELAFTELEERIAPLNYTKITF